MNYLTKMRNTVEDMTENERKIATFLLSHADILKTVSSRKLAQQLNISQSSIVKFAQKLGAEGFTELRMVLIEEFSILREKHHHSIQHLHGSITSEDSLEIIAGKLNREKQSALEQTYQLMDYDRLRKILDVIGKARFIQVTGIGVSALVGKDLSLKLIKIGYRVNCEADPHVQVTVAQALREGDVQIVFSESGSKKEIVLCAEVARSSGAIVIAITSLSESPLRRLAHYTLDTVSGAKEPRSSSINVRTAQSAVTDLLFVGMVQRNNVEALQMIKQSRDLVGRLE